MNVVQEKNEQRSRNGVSIDEKQSRNQTRRVAHPSDRLGDNLARVSGDTDTPEDTLQVLAAAYVDFALSEEKLWFAAFNHRLPDGADLPEWHQAEYLGLVQYLAKPLAQLLPDLAPDACTLRALTLFASVHGVVQMSLNGQFAGAPREALPTEIKSLVAAISRGLG